MRSLVVVLFAFLSAQGFAQANSVDPAHVPAPGSGSPDLDIPVKKLEFKPVDAQPVVSLTPLTSTPQCSPNGSLFLNLIYSKDLQKQTLISVQGTKSQTYSLTAISDLHDVFVYSFFPTDSVVGFLVRASKESPGTPGHGKSPAGIAWKDYHTYVAEFSRDGTYRKSVELPMNDSQPRFAIFPTGEFLLGGFDDANAKADLVLMDSSGKVIRSIDMPAARAAAEMHLPYRSLEAAKASRNLMASLAFTSYGKDILVWRGESRDPILDIGSGGSVREVPLQPPAGTVFVDMLSSTDRWVAHFRSTSVAQNSPFNQADYSYYELHPQDASLAYKLLQAGDIPQSIACEVDGDYLAYKTDDKSKLVLLKAE